MELLKRHDSRASREYQRRFLGGEKPTESPTLRRRRNPARLRLRFFENRLKKVVAPGRGVRLRKPVSQGVAALGGSGHDRVIVQNNPINRIDPLGLYDTPAFVTHLTTSVDMIATMATAPTSGPKAIAAGISFYADTVGFHTAEANSTEGIALNLGSGAISTAAAFVGGSFLGTAVSTFGLAYSVGTLIDKAYGDNISDFIWNISHPKKNCP